MTIPDPWSQVPTDAKLYSLDEGVKYTKVMHKGTWVGINEYHISPAGSLCYGYVPFEVPEGPTWKVRWQVVSWEPLTLSPSLLCEACNHHGFVQNGKWIPC